MKPERKTLKQIGEDELIRRLTADWPELIKNSATIDNTPWVILGVGDDCAVLRTHNASVVQLLKVDAVCEHVHFLPDTPPERIGWKALARVISDIAAMGGYPVAAMITLGASPDETYDRINKIYRGLTQCAREYKVALVGGETTASSSLFISVTMTGLAERNKVCPRCSAKDGDAILVTGQLGGSIRGKHLSFSPRLQEALWLVEHFKPNAMMDISDGLAADLPRLESANQLHAHIDFGSVPVSEGCTLEQALGDGEDYELLFTLPQKKAKALLSAWPFRLQLTQIGVMSRKPAPKLSASGYDHFIKR